MKKILLTIVLSIFSCVVFAIKPLPVDKAFDFSVKPTDSQTLEAKWKIVPGYHLYRDHITFEVKAPTTAKIMAVQLPQGTVKDDKILGRFEVYEHDFTVKIPLANVTNPQLILIAHYQGCADHGFCFPPVTKQLELKIPNVAAKAGEPEAMASKAGSENTSVAQQDKITQLLSHKNWALILLGFLGFGVLLAFTPCVLPMIPILSGIIVGESDEITALKAFWLSFTYVMAMAITYAIAGVVAGLAGGYVQAFLQNPWVLVAFSGVFVLLAFSLFGFYELRMPHILHHHVTQLSNKHSGGDYVGVAVMGCLSTLIVSPCVTAPLLGALSYIGRTGDAVLGGSALFAMGIGMGVPLLIIGTVGGKFLPKAGAWMDAVKAFFGVLMLGVAILLLSRVIPPQVTMLLWAGLLIISAVYMGALSVTPSTGFGKLWKGISIILLVYGFLLLIGAGMGNTEVFEPLAVKTLSVSPVKPVTTSFKTVKTVDDFQTALAEAKADHKPVILDFYADWCLSCKELDRATFKDPRVQALLSKFVLLRSDVTANDEKDKALEKKLNVIAPPTILFFSPNGDELAMRIVGAVDAKEFLAHLQKVLERAEKP